MWCLTLKWSGEMSRKVTKVSVVLVLLIYFQLCLSNLHATTTKFVSPAQSKSSSESAKLMEHASGDSNSNTIHNSNHIAHSGGFDIDNGGKRDKEQIEVDEDEKVIEDEEKIRQMFPNLDDIIQKHKMNTIRLNGRPTKYKTKDKFPQNFIELVDNITKHSFTSNLYRPGGHLKSANTMRAFYPTGNGPDLPNIHNHLRFEITPVPKNEKATGAELRLPITWKNNNPKCEDLLIYIVVHDVVKYRKTHTDQNNKSHKQSIIEPITYPLDSKSLSLCSVKDTSNPFVFWISFDVFPVISKLATFSKTNNIGIALEIVHKDGEKLSAEILADKNFSVIKSDPSSRESRISSMLLIYLDDGGGNLYSKNLYQIAKPQSRHVRSVQKHKKRSNHRNKNRRRNVCSRKKMYVNFSDVGWTDWILAPPGYQAYHCSGECPFPMAEHLNASNHAVIQALVNSYNPRAVPPPCCVPIKYSSVSILYTDSSDLPLLKVYKNMSVESCGCR